MSKEEIVTIIPDKQIIIDKSDLDFIYKQKSNLEAKLAEKKKQCQDCKHLNKKIELNIKNKLMAEIEQLKQQLAEQPKQIVEKIKEYCWYGGAWLEDNYYKVTDKILDTILKELQGE